MYAQLEERRKKKQLEDSSWRGLLFCKYGHRFPLLLRFLLSQSLFQSNFITILIIYSNSNSIEVYKVKIAHLSSPPGPPSPWQFVLVQLLFSINFFILVLSPHSPKKVFFFRFLYLMGEGESVIKCLWQWSSGLLCVTRYQRLWFSGSGVLLWCLDFIKTSMVILMSQQDWESFTSWITQQS